MFFLAEADNHYNKVNKITCLQTTTMYGDVIEMEILNEAATVYNRYDSNVTYYISLSRHRSCSTDDFAWWIRICFGKFASFSTAEASPYHVGSIVKLRAHGNEIIEIINDVEEITTSFDQFGDLVVSTRYLDADELLNLKKAV